MKFCGWLPVIALFLILSAATVPEAIPLRPVTITEPQYRYPALNPGNTTPALPSQPYRAWGLENTEWVRYLELMEGPRGTWSADLSPVAVLGIHAKDPAERERFAEHYVQLQSARIKAELAFQKAVNQAVERHYAAEEAFISSTQSPRPVTGDVQHLQMYAAPSCETVCTQLLEQAYELLGRDRGRLDIYLEQAADDRAVRSWAYRQGVDPLQVRSGRITLNHGNGNWYRLARTYDLDTELPKLLLLRGTSSPAVVGP